MANKSKYPLYCFISFEDESDWDDKDKLLAVVFEYIRKLDRGLAWLLVKDVDRHCGEGEDDNRLTCTAHCAVYQLELEVDRLRETMVFSVRPHNGKHVMCRKRLDLIDIDYGEIVLIPDHRTGPPRQPRHDQRGDPGVPQARSQIGLAQVPARRAGQLDRYSLASSSSLAGLSSSSVQ